MLAINTIRRTAGNIIVLGAHKGIIQSILDFDYFCGKDAPSICGIVTSASRFQKYGWGDSEVMIPCFGSVADIPKDMRVSWMLNVNSGRRALSTTTEFFDSFPKARGGHIFAEDVPELHAISLYDTYRDKLIIGPAGVGLIIPGALKLGAIGGTDWRQVSRNHLYKGGNVAILSASGGMINEIITMVASSQHGISFALCFGGDRFPVVRPRDAFLAAEADDKTEHIVYYGELGGYDEYEVAELIASGQVTKPVTCYIAGVIGENFDQPVQFGHAKALAGSASETATAKRRALREAGARVAESMSDFSTLIGAIPPWVVEQNPPVINRRTPSLFTSTISGEEVDGYHFVGDSLQQWAMHSTIPEQIVAGLLGRRPRSRTTADFIEKVFLLSVDHGPQVSGAVTTIIAARAGKGLVDSLAAGLMSIGPRFGGAVTGAADEWFSGVLFQRNPAEHVEMCARARHRISGIGHKKYRVGLPDPRVELLSSFVEKLKKHPHYDYARRIEDVTTAKKGSLILNVDGVIAALMLDILLYEEDLSYDDVRKLIDADFFNALFVIPRTVGFISHYLDQKRLDEGLFRLPDDDVLLID